ncbi:MAG: c(7)-type cytochrome triheme domain-containing protein [Bryobacteraceae bacterium]
MRVLTSLTAIAFLLCGLLVLAAANAPEKLVFESKMGKVTYLHAKHAERAKNDCTVCHDKLWPQSAKAPLNFKAAMHKTAEKAKSSCAACHVAGGTAFVTTGNCAKCHVKG